MGFNAIKGLWLLPLLGLIIIMYILKEEHEEKEISSLFLWKSVLADSEVKKPWQKLKNNILMILQLLAAFMMIMALSNPFIRSGKAVGGNIIIAIDKSGSMNAELDGAKRLDIAKSMAEKIIIQAPSHSSYTIISVDKDAKIEVSNTRDKSEAIKGVKNINSSNLEGSLNQQLSMIEAIYRQFEDSVIQAYTDEPLYLKDMEGQVINLGGRGENAGLTNISYSDEGDSYTILIKIENTGDSPLKREIILYGEEELIGLQELELSPKESKNIYFQDIKKDYRYFYGEISEKDILLEDNKAYLVPHETSVKKALLVSKGNVFVERALGAIEGIELYKTDSFDIEDASFDLYIFDGVSPSLVPEKASLMFINIDSSNKFFNVSDTSYASMGNFAEHELNRYLNDYEFYINKRKIVDKPYWADPLIISSDSVLAGVGVFEARKIAYTSFDIRDSDLALSPAFPIFMYNVVSYLADLEAKGQGFYESGEPIEMDFAMGLEDLLIKTPSGKEERIKDDRISYGYTKTGEIGIYNLSYKKNDLVQARFFAVNFPSQESRNAFQDWESEEGDLSMKRTHRTAKDIKTILILLALLILLAEWVVYIRGI